MRRGRPVRVLRLAGHDLRFDERWELGSAVGLKTRLEARRSGRGDPLTLAILRKLGLLDRSG